MNEKFSDAPAPLPGTAPMAADNWDSAAVTSWYTRNPDAAVFEILTAGDLAGLAKLVNEGREDFSGKTVRLAADIDLAGKNWTPIGAGSGSVSFPFRHFHGSFHGGGHTIANMNVKITADGQESGGDGGLFSVSSAEQTTEDVHLTDFSIALFSSNYSAGAGGLAGTNYGSISGCTASGNISVSSTAVSVPHVGSYAFAVAGGLVGVNLDGRIANCAANVDLTVFSYAPGPAGNGIALSGAGGLVGNNMRGSITACAAGGSISAVTEAVSSESCACAGGLVGSNGRLSGAGRESVIKDCAASAKNIRAAGGSVCLGGFIGENSSHTIFENNRNETGVTPAVGRDERKNPAGPGDDI